MRTATDGNLVRQLDRWDFTSRFSIVKSLKQKYLCIMFSQNCVVVFFIFNLLFFSWAQHHVFLVSFPQALGHNWFPRVSCQHYAEFAKQQLTCRTQVVSETARLCILGISDEFWGEAGASQFGDTGMRLSPNKWKPNISQISQFYDIQCLTVDSFFLSVPAIPFSQISWGPNQCTFRGKRL